MSEVTESAFETAADATLHALQQALDALPDVEADLSLGVLTLSFDSEPDYVVNSHRAAKQIWMAADRTAWHFDVNPTTGAWVATKSGEELWSALSAALTRRLGRSVVLTG